MNEITRYKRNGICVPFCFSLYLTFRIAIYNFYNFLVHHSHHNYIRMLHYVMLYYVIEPKYSIDRFFSRSILHLPGLSITKWWEMHAPRPASRAKPGYNILSVRNAYHLHNFGLFCNANRLSNERIASAHTLAHGYQIYTSHFTHLVHNQAGVQGFCIEANGPKCGTKISCNTKHFNLLRKTPKMSNTKRRSRIA